MVKVQGAEGDCREDLLKSERRCIEQLGATLNKQVPGRSRTQHYQANRAEISEKRKEKVTCACGSVVSNRNIAKHYKSKKHLNYLESTK